MDRPAAQRKKMKVVGIAQPTAKDRFLDFIKKKYTVSSIADRGLHVSLHIRVTMEDKSCADIIIFTNDTVTMSASPSASSTAFDTLAEDVQKVAEMSTKPVTVSRPLACLRAQQLMGYVKSLDTSVELNRMVAVILSDTANEIVLREKLRLLHVSGPALDEGVPEKIKRIEAKGEQVYRKDDVINVRDLRNEVVHKGNIPIKDEADKVIQISSDFVSKA